MIAMILVRALRKDIAQYNDANVEDAKEESGWKLVHGDVFRPPAAYPMVRTTTEAHAHGVSAPVA